MCIMYIVQCTSLYSITFRISTTLPLEVPAMKLKNRKHRLLHGHYGFGHELALDSYEMNLMDFISVYHIFTLYRE